MRNKLIRNSKYYQRSKIIDTKFNTKNIKPKTTIHPSKHVSIRYQQKRYQNNPEDSLLDLMLAIAHAHTSTRATSLMRVKNSMRHFCL